MIMNYYNLADKILETKMEALEVTSLKDRLVISIDKTLISKEYLLNLLNRLQVENLATKADFDEKVMDIAEEIKTGWWKKNKDTFLKKKQAK